MLYELNRSNIVANRVVLGRHLRLCPRTTCYGLRTGHGCKATGWAVLNGPGQSATHLASYI
jgi:hypothetical protein